MTISHYSSLNDGEVSNPHVPQPQSSLQTGKGTQACDLER